MLEEPPSRVFNRGVCGGLRENLSSRRRETYSEEVPSQRNVKNQEVRDFLVTRRAKITPEQAGLPYYGSNRRVEGLRREEAAMLAGVSVDYYTRLEKGNLAGASESVLDAIAHALQLDDAERLYLFDLARAANAAYPDVRRSRVTSNSPRTQVRASMQRVLDGMSEAPAFVRNGRLDILATNALGRALYAPVFDSPTRTSSQTPPNLARFRFLDPAARSFFPDFDVSAPNNVKLLRAEAARTPHDKDFTSLIGELSTRSEEFRRLWGSHDVRAHESGTKRFHHPVVGELRLDFEALELSSAPGLTLTAYTASADSSSADALKLLASWAKTHSQQLLDEQSTATKG